MTAQVHFQVKFTMKGKCLKVFEHKARLSSLWILHIHRLFLVLIPLSLHIKYSAHCWTLRSKNSFTILMKYFSSFSAWRSIEKLSSDVKCVYCHFHVPASQYKHAFTSNESIKKSTLASFSCRRIVQAFHISDAKTLFCNVSSVSYFQPEPSFFLLSPHTGTFKAYSWQPYT